MGRVGGRGRGRSNLEFEILFFWFFFKKVGGCGCVSVGFERESELWGKERRKLVGE